VKNTFKAEIHATSRVFSVLPKWLRARYAELRPYIRETTI